MREVKKMTDDIISRAAAIALVEEIESKRLKGEIDLTYAPMIKGIKALPPAHSEQPEWVQAVERWYNKALCNPCIHKPLAWALYQVWKEYDNEG